MLPVTQGQPNCIKHHVAVWRLQPSRRDRKHEGTRRLSRLLDGQRHRLPLKRGSHLRHRRKRDGIRLTGKRARRGGCAQPATIHLEHAVHPVQQPFEPMLGDHDGQPEVLVEPRERGQHVLRTPWVELTGRLIQHEQVRVQGQRSGDRYPLALPTG